MGPESGGPASLEDPEERGIHPSPWSFTRWGRGSDTGHVPLPKTSSDPRPWDRGPLLPKTYRTPGPSLPV